MHLLPGDLIRLVETPKEKAKDAVAALGGVDGIAYSLNVSLDTGLYSSDTADLAARQDMYGKNYIEPSKPQTLLQLMWHAFQDLTIIVLTCAGVLSLILGFTVGHKEKVVRNTTTTTTRALSGNAGTAWIEGFSILLAVTIVVLVTALNNYQKDKQFRALNAVKDDESIKVLRDGAPCEVSKFDLVVGDIVRLDVGDILPADGVVIQSHDLKLDESAMTGESFLMLKDKVTAPFLFSGTKVMEGMGSMLVLCVGASSQAGMISSLVMGSTAQAKEAPLVDNSVYVEVASPRGSLHEAKVQAHGGSSKHDTISPLQGKLDKLTLFLGKFGFSVATLVVVALAARYSIDKFAVQKASWSTDDLKELLHFFIVGVSVLVVAIPEGLPLAVTISLAFSVKKMLADNNLVRHLSACETMGSATTICSDKTGTLTTNRMTVMRCRVGAATFAPTTDASPLSPTATELLVHAICLNSTAELIGVDRAHTGNKTECALLTFVLDVLRAPSYADLRKDHGAVCHWLPFSSAKKRMSIVVPTSATTCRVYTKGASEIVLGLCSMLVTVEGAAVPLTDPASHIATIAAFASEGLRTLCIAYRDIDAPFETVVGWPEMQLESDLSCVAIVGIEDPLRPEVPDAIRQCNQAGIVVRMVTGDNIDTATSIARKCGILPPSDPDALVMEGVDFRSTVLDARGNIKQDAFDEIWPRLRVLARSSPQDKYTLVSGMMQSTLHGPQVVAVTGDGTNDAPALKKANVGFAMGICGTAVSKDASDIILMDDNFKSIVNAVKWGRNVYDSVSKFLQFQLTVTVTAITLCVVGAIVLEETPLTAIQLLWVNLIMNTFASLALATGTPTDAMLERKPYPKTKALISKKMTKHIVGQALFQLAVLLTLTFKGEELLEIPSGRKYEIVSTDPSQHYTVIFNTFVFLQLFNEINARCIHDEKSIFTGFLANRVYLGISVIQVLLQVLIVEFGGSVFECAPLTVAQWFVCLGLGALSLPVGFFLRRIHSHHLPKSFGFVRKAPTTALRFHR
ncbi:P-type ATPase (P-ATPase) Superfamily [Achlya hypogyna]|uniref:Calcium-transporting ATPase n=1 Tax=Achlya hypogyna TaxID=1202772 RepID=A0A1V9YDP0_ACHHY|nr:P-type ATPase (P-ATPase) Superfamily [Achlya hypogyna]